MKEPRIFPRERPTPWTRAPLPPRGRMDGSLGPQGGQGPALNTGHPLGMASDSFLMASGSLGGNLAPFPRNHSFPASSGSLASNPAPFPAGARDSSMASFPRGMNPTAAGAVSFSRPGGLLGPGPGPALNPRAGALPGPGPLSNPRSGGLPGPGPMPHSRAGGLLGTGPDSRSGGPMGPGSGPNLRTGVLLTPGNGPPNTRPIGLGPGPSPNLRSGFMGTNPAPRSGMFPGPGLGPNPKP